MSLMTKLIKDVPGVASWLDVRYPGWAERINLETFDIHKSEHCLGGQLLGQPAGWYQLAREYAFDHDCELESGLDHFGFAATNEAWRREIKRRVAVPESVPTA